MSGLHAGIGGVMPIAPTAFFPDGAIDQASMARLFTHYLDCGAAGVTVLGQLGEAPKLTHQESVTLVQQAVRAMGTVPVVVGVSAPGFASMRALAHDAMLAGAAGVMVAPPNTLRTDDQILSYYTQATEALGADVPMVVQDYPLSFSVQMTPGLIRRMVQALPAVVMLKHEDWPGLDKISALRGFEAEGSMRRLAILCGNGGLFFDQELRRGADGANTGYAFADMLCDMVRMWRAGQVDAMQDLFDAHLPLLRYEQQPGVGLAVRKYVLMRRGLLTHDALRQPGAALGATARAEVDYLLQRVARVDPRAQM